MGLGGILGGIGSVIAAPFTGGASLSLLPVVGSAVGGALNNTKGARTSTVNQTTISADSPENAALASLLRSIYTRRLNAPVPLQGYEAQGISGINDAFRGINENLNANLTARGLSTSPVAATVAANSEMARGGQLANFLNSLPLLQRQMQDADIAAANQFYAAQPKTVTTSGTSVGPGSALGSAFGSAAEMLAFMAGNGSLGGQGKPRGSSGGSLPVYRF